LAKSKTQYVCGTCGATSLGWLGRCPKCGEWNTLVQQAVQTATAPRQRSSGIGERSAAVPLSQVVGEAEVRLPVPMDEMARVLGGGLVPGSVTLLAGEPGIGKSTLVLQLAMYLADTVGPVLYVSAEESARQLGLRARRLGPTPDGMYVVSDPSVEAIIEHMDNMKPVLTVVDSVQAVRLEGRPGAAGSVVQVRDSSAALSRTAKEAEMPLVLIGHVTKTGVIAGPRVLEHLVDTVLYLEGDHYHTYRMLRSVKNRFGSTNEVGVFEMTGEGMREVSNPSEAFLAERLVGAAGTAVVITLEGTRPMLVEVQALTSKAAIENVRRNANGYDFKRLLLLGAVLSKRAGISLAQQDIFVNVVGGMRLSEPAADLAVAMAIASSAIEKPLPADMAFVGEVGLSGEVRSVAQVDRRISEAARLGFRSCMVPRSIGRAYAPAQGCEVLPVRSLNEAIDKSGLR
jgi:DNA repair protein RadA/Sms